MFSRLHKHFGTTGLVVAIVALVAALAGTAIAASGGLSGKQKKEVKKIAKEFAGAGPQGPTGPAGPQGDKGNPGANGTNGAAGSTGPAGPTGTAGTNGTKGATGPTGTTGPTGPTGTTGPEGVCGTTNCVLPTGATEGGTWALTELTAELGSKGVKIPISFPIRLAAAITETHVFEGEEAIPSGCTGTVEEFGAGSKRVVDLGANPGNFCVYIRTSVKLTASALFSFNGETGAVFQAGRSGAVLSASPPPEAGAKAEGTWAVTAP
jgi:hypothetical protein